MVIPEILSCPSSYHTLQWKKSPTFKQKSRVVFVGLGWEFPRGWRKRNPRHKCGALENGLETASNMASLGIYLKFRGVPPVKQTWQWKITLSNSRYIFKWLSFHCHVSFLGCKHFWDSWDYIQILHQVFNYSDNFLGSQDQLGSWSDHFRVGTTGKNGVYICSGYIFGLPPGPHVHSHKCRFDSGFPNLKNVSLHPGGEKLASWVVTVVPKLYPNYISTMYPNSKKHQ